MSDGTMAQKFRNTREREEFAQEYGFLAVQSGSYSPKDVFSVTWNDKTLYPAFQFDDQGRPLPVLKSVLDIFGNVLQGWEIAFWFTSNNPWLDECSLPVDLLLTSPGEVIEAAHGAILDIPE